MTLGQNIHTSPTPQATGLDTQDETIAVSRQALGKWEKDTALPGLDNLQALAAELGTGSRYFENLVDETKTTLDDQFMALSERYMKTNCACFTPNHGRIDDLLRMVKEYKVDGVIDCSLKFCCLYDTEKYSVARALKEAGVPVLGLETDYTDTDAEQLRTRIGAFIEMLNNR